MKKKSIKYIISTFFFFLFSFSFLSTNLIFAEESVPAESKLEKLLERQVLAIKKIKDAITANSKEVKNTNKINELAGEKLQDLNVQIKNIEDLINYYDHEIDKKDKIILSLNKQIASNENDIILIEDEVSKKELEIENQKRFMSDMLKFIYETYDMQDDISTRDSLDKNPIKLFLSDKNISQYDQDIQYLSIFQETSADIFEKLKKSQNELNDLKGKLQSKKTQLSQTKASYDDEQKDLKSLKEAKEKALADSKLQKGIFEKRIEFAKKKQEQISKETEVLFRTLQILNGDLDKYKNDPNVDIDLALILQDEFAKLDMTVSDDMIWPASPYRGITTLFHDPSYPFKSAIGQHSGIDVRMPQGTPLVAPINGLVTYANGYGVSEGDPNYYAFHKVVITDETGRSVMLGHASETFVQKGDYVMQGDLVALTGAMPGTKGAGAYTTGPHLHFELYMPIYDSLGNKKISLVDPLEYFPLDEVPLETLSENYLINLLEKRKDENDILGGMDLEEYLEMLEDSSDK